MNGATPVGQRQSAILQLPKVDATTVGGEQTAPQTRWVQGLPEALRLAPVTELPWAEPALREVSAHCERLGLDPARTTLADLCQAEFELAQAHDPEITAAQLQAAIDRAMRAQQRAPRPMSMLFGFTYLLDEKVDLTPALVSQLARAVARSPDGKDVLDLVRQGPPPDRSGGVGLVWPDPATPKELVASLIRQLLSGGAKSVPINLRQELVDWLQGQLEGEITRRSMGGASAFGAKLAAAHPQIQATFWAEKRLPREIAEMFGDDVRIVDADGQYHLPSEWIDEEARPRINYALEYQAGERLDLWGLSELEMRYGNPPEVHSRDMVVDDSGRIQVSTPSNEEPGFHPSSPAVLEKLGEEHDLAFLTGHHYFTRGRYSPEEAADLVEELAEHVASMKEAHRRRWGDQRPELIAHLQYVKAKKADLEATVLTGLSEVNDAHTLNAAEAPAVVDNLRLAGRTDAVPPSLASPDAKEPAPYMLKLAQQQLTALGAPMVRVRGVLGDVLALRAGALPGFAPEDFVLALMRSRQVGAMKCANASGQFDGPKDIYPVAPRVDGASLAEARPFARALQAQFGFSDQVGEQVAQDWHYRAPDGTLFVFAPGRNLYEFLGGKISLGDTYDLGFWLALLADPDPGAGNFEDWR